MALVFAIMHLYNILKFILYLSIPFLYFSLTWYRYIRRNGRYQHVLALCALLTGVILKWLTLRKFVFDVCVCMFYVCELIGFVDWLDRGLIYMWEEFRNVYLLWSEFDCPEVTLCGWQDIKIQLLLLLLREAHCTQRLSTTGQAQLTSWLSGGCA